ncbi:MAG TPA: ABC transporter ATP-binding protein [Clostridia bacterium]|nr:ABC transporter ATP-binding protein [Clostridia bacterium]
MALLEAKKLTMTFGGLMAVDSVSFNIEQGEILGLIGPNGAGKTTCFNLLTGIYQPTSGEILFKGENLRGYKTYEVTKKGIARTFQNIRLFGAMTVLENVLIGQHCRTKTGLFGAITRLGSVKKEEENAREKAEELLKFVGLLEKKNEKAKNLPYGEQRRLEIARALATDPELLLLDEPAAGMNPQETNDLIDLIKQIRQMGKTILLIEHDMKLVMGICDRIVVLDYGKKIADGTPKEIRENSRVIKAYLGDPD